MNYVSLIGTLEGSPRVVNKKGLDCVECKITTKKDVINKAGVRTQKFETHVVFAWGKWSRILLAHSSPNLKVAVEGEIVNFFTYYKGRVFKNTEIEINDLILM